MLKNIGPRLWALAFGLAALFGSLSLGWGWWTIAPVVVAFLYGGHAWNYEKRSRPIFGPFTQLLIAALALIYYFVAAGWQSSFTGIGFVVVAAVIAFLDLLEALSPAPQHTNRSGVPNY